MKAWLGRFILSCARAYENRGAEEVRRTPKRHIPLEVRVDNNMPALAAYKIENGFIIDTPSGMRYCKDANEIAEAIVVSDTKQKMGLKSPQVLREAALAYNNGSN